MYTTPPAGSGPFSQVGNEISGTSTTVTSGLVNGTSYWFEVEAYSSANSGYISSWSVPSRPHRTPRPGAHRQLRGGSARSVTSVGAHPPPTVAALSPGTRVRRYLRRRGVIHPGQRRHPYQHPRVHGDRPAELHLLLHGESDQRRRTGTASTEVSATPYTAPGAISNLSASVSPPTRLRSPGQLRQQRLPITDYSLYYGGAFAADAGSSSPFTYNGSSLTPGQPYSFTMTATNSAGLRGIQRHLDHHLQHAGSSHHR